MARCHSLGSSYLFEHKMKRMTSYEEGPCPLHSTISLKFTCLRSIHTAFFPFMGSLTRWTAVKLPKSQRETKSNMSKLSISFL